MPATTKYRLYRLRQLGLLAVLGFVVLQVSLWTFVWSRAEPPFYSYSQIEPRLFMGGHVARPPPGTSAVLNLDQLPDDYTCSHHAWEPIPDCPPAPGLDWLRKQVAFVDANRRANRVTFVHCHAGISRSGMVVIAYLMAIHGWTRDEALAFVRRSRPEVRPNPAFWDLLAEWESHLTEH